ncbi:MAG: inositol monophosphatase [Verrucomicrobia bacterium]|nr:inositol monophosphatase [Verrucomicrobiota bacterium]
MISVAIRVARDAGRHLWEHFGDAQQINYAETHDIKLQMDVDCQRLIETRLLEAFPSHSIVGEEESHGDPDAEYRWIVDPLDGTVNYTYGIPHYCVSIALQRRNPNARSPALPGAFQTVLAVVYDPMRDELFMAEKGGGAFLNGQPLRVSERTRLEETIVSVGFAKTEESLEKGLRFYPFLLRRARKIRTMGSAALDLAYVAGGRLDMYLEFTVKLWDIAAGALLVEEAGGAVELQPVANAAYTFQTLAWNGKMDWKKLIRL